MSVFKPSLNFLLKVEAGKVYSTWNYSPNKGGYSKFFGGEKTYEKHREAGYVGWCPGGSMGRRGVLKLTEKGVAFLNEHRPKTEGEEG